MQLQIIAADINVALAGAERLGDLLDQTTLNLSTGNLLLCTRTADIQPAMPGFNSLLYAIYTANVHVECQVFNAA